MTRHHVVLSPGMFGFGRLGSFDYFSHLERELRARFAAAGHELVAHPITDLPTASIRRRATRLAEVVAALAATTGDDPIHLLGHSTGGLDARLVASPATRSIPAGALAWLPRLRSVTTMNTPHFGTPLAAFFTTSNGQRALAALSVLTFAGLSLGAQPLAAASMLLGFLRRSEKVLPLKPQLLDRSVASILGLVDDARSPEIRPFLAAIMDDQGSMLQLSPESMDLFAAGFEDRPGVIYQSTASMAPAPKPRRWLATLGHPWRAVSMSLFVALHKLTSAVSERYPCEGLVVAANELVLARAFDAPPPRGANDGVVPIRSQLWGKLVWVGLGDHLDVLGHYSDRRTGDIPAALHHRDWLTSGSDFGDADLARLCDEIAAGMLGL